MAFKPTILVVGADGKCKARMSKALAKHNGAEEVLETRVGNVVYSSQGKPIVVETTTWNATRNITETRDSQEIADAWIALNFLQTLFNKLISVVCVIDLTRLQHRFHHEKSELYSRKYVFLTLLADNFVNFRETIQIVVMIKGSEMRKNRVRDFLLQNGFEESNIFFRRNAPKVGEDPHIPLTPFILTPRKQFGVSVPPVKVILFGRAGNGKSTLAQMLTLQKLDSSSNAFQTSSGVDGSTRGSKVGIKHGQGRGWYVVDTPGLGKPSEKLSSRSTRDVAINMFEDIQSTHGLFTHFIYVRKQDRFDTLDEEIWKFFMRIFGEYIKSNFTVVITNSDQGWVETHMSTLREIFVYCQSFLCADFPMIEPDDDELEEENCKVRVESLQQLEKGLAILGRHPVEYNYRQVSKTDKSSGFHKSLLSVKHATKQVADRAGTSTARGLAKANVQVWKKWKRMFKRTGQVPKTF